MPMRYFRSWFVLLLVVACLVPCQAQEKVRTWSDASGQFEIQATYVSEKAGVVTLRNAAGEEFEIELAKLSDADRKYVAALKSNPFRKKPESPFKPRMSDAAATAGGPVDWTGVPRLSVPLHESGWKVEPPQPSAFEVTPRKVGLPKKTDFFEKQSATVGNDRCGRVAVGYWLAGRGREREQGTSRFAVADLLTGKLIGTGKVEGQTQVTPMAVDDSGEYVVMRHGPELEVWTFTRSGGTKVRSWEPYPDGGKGIASGGFLNDDQLLTWREGEAAVWDFASSRPLYRFSVSGRPTISPDRRYVAFVAGGSVALLDTQKQEIIAAAPTPGKLNWPTCSFSPSGKRIGCVAFDRILVWDTATGELYRDIPLKGIHINGQISFPHDDYVIVGGGYLLELENRLRAWQYDGTGQQFTMGKYSVLAINGSPEGAVMIGEIPHAAVIEAVEKALTRPDLFVFRKGVAVRLDCNGVPGGQSARVEKSLRDKLAAMECTVADDAKVSLVATVSGPRTATRSYMRSGDHTVTEYSTSLKLVYDGKTAWQTGGGNIPFMLSLKRGENVAGKLAELSKGPDYSFFDRIRLPEFVQHPGESTPGRASAWLGLGKSKVTINGIQ